MAKLGDKMLLIRADASAANGTGHVMRCLALAQAWQDAGGRVIFALAEGAEEIGERLRSEGAVVVRVSGELGSREDAGETAQLCTRYRADWLILDGFHFSQSYRESVKTDASRLLLLDDHGERAPYKCDLVLNANPQASDAMYPQREEQTCFLLGPQYALLRREFLGFPTISPDVPATASRVLITFGGADPHNVTLRVVEALQEVHDVQLDITVLVGASNPHRASLRAAIERSFHVARLLSDVDNMPEVMTQAELAISAGGGTCYELAIMQVPMFLITMAKNHEQTVEAFSRASAALAAGRFEALGREALAASLRGLIGDPRLRKELAENARRMVDGKGAQRVVDAMCSMHRGGQDNYLIQAGNNPARWELGSEFHWPGLAEPPLLTWPQPAAWYMLARHAVAAVAQVESGNKPTLWLPSYFCPEVADCCRHYCEIREYRDMPFWAEADWKSLEPKSQDIVLAVNYFGVRDGTPWKNWRERVRCILLEDHSQDPFSAWALTSTADFAFASARKTLPIPDGAILWSPQGLKLPSPPVEGDWSGSALKVAAMLYKMEYLRGAGTDELKRKFRDLQLRGEDLMRKSKMSAISPSSFVYIADGVPQAWRNQRSTNARHLLNNLKKIEHVDCVISRWPDGAVPFALPILFRSRRERDECQALLQRHKIYCPVHWVCQTTDIEALDLSARILSLPVDQRYTEGDVDCISEVMLHAWSPGRAEGTSREATE